MSGRDLSNLPSVSKLLETEALRRFPHHWAAKAARIALEEARASTNGLPTTEAIINRAATIARQDVLGAYRAAVNCSGTILNTGLGRAKLAPAAIEAMQAAAGHASLELDLETGKRGDRQSPLAGLLCELTGAEAALVVNNNAAAVMLAISTFAVGKEVLLSRGQSVEIGGSFRMPDVVRSAGAILVDVGTTNKTRLSDYAQAITPNTGAILRCHPSNFVIEGFVEEATANELAKVGNDKGIPVVDDVGSGCLINTEEFGLPHETTLKESLASGADVITASGDKLLGGPQAGILLGKRDAIERIKKNPLARAVRIDKLAAAAMNATLKLYLEGKQIEIPTLQYLARKEAEVKELATSLCDKLTASNVVCKMESSMCEPGGGSLPGAKLPSYRVGIDSNPDALARSLRTGAMPIIGYIESKTLWFDMRTVDTEEVPIIVEAILSCCKLNETQTSDRSSNK